MAALPADIKHISWAAEQLGIGLSTAYRLAEAGHLPGAFKVGAQWRISVPAFRREVHGDEAPPAAEDPAYDGVERRRAAVGSRS